MCGLHRANCSDAVSNVASYCMISHVPPHSLALCRCTSKSIIKTNGIRDGDCAPTRSNQLGSELTQSARATDDKCVRSVELIALEPSMPNVPPDPAGRAESGLCSLRSSRTITPPSTVCLTNRKLVVHATDFYSEVESSAPDCSVARIVTLKRVEFNPGQTIPLLKRDMSKQCQSRNTLSANQS